MKVLWAAAAIGLGLIGSASAQSWGGYDDGPRYRERDRGYEYRERGGYGDRGYRDRDYGERRDFGDRGPRGGRNAGFDEREYLRCNADVRGAVQRGQATSGYDHYRMFGRREGRRLSC